MDFSPECILQRLEQLQKWQQRHEKIISEKNQNTEEFAKLPSINYTETTATQVCDRNVFRQNGSNNIDDASDKKLLAEHKPSTGGLPRPFLRKGTGLQRYKMKHSRPNTARSLRNSSNPSCPLPLNNLNITPLTVPTATIQHRSDCLEMQTQQPPMANALPTACSNSDSLSGIGDQTLELMLFEALEKKANNSSFCSSSSSVVDLLQRPSNNFVQHRAHQSESSNPTNAIIHTVNVETQSEHNKSPDHDDRPCSPPIELERPMNKPPEMFTTAAVQVHFSDENKWSSSSSISSTDTHESSTDEDEVSPNTTAKELNLSGAPVANSDAHVCHTEQQTNLNQPVQAVVTACARCTIEMPKLLREKDEHFERMRTKLKKELIEKTDILERELRKRLQHFDDEQKDLMDQLERERKKAAKERAVFDMYIKDSRDRPNRRERDEMVQLRQEVADLKEMHKLKESRNGMTQARLRNHIKQLEKQIDELKQQNERLLRENGRLLASQKIGIASRARSAPSSASNKNISNKMLQEITENVTKMLLKDQKGGSLSDSQSDQKLSANNDEEGCDKENVNSQNTIEQQYIELFGNSAEGADNQTRPILDKFHTDHKKSEQTLPDGSRLVQYNNGNTKLISADGNTIKITYMNGDIKETSLLAGTIRYFFHDDQTWTTSHADGSETTEFASGQKEIKFPDGRKEIEYPDNVHQIIYPNGKEKVEYPDGSYLEILNANEKILHLPNGQTETHTNEYKKRSYPDGTTKTVYHNGRQETHYPNGRLRIKDSHGNLIHDSDDFRNDADIAGKHVSFLP